MEAASGARQTGFWNGGPTSASGPELIKQAESDAAEIIPLSNGFQVLLPHGITHNQAVNIIKQRLEQRFAERRKAPPCRH
eukprot:tig00000821_g4525.t1